MEILVGSVQTYAWGAPDVIAKLQGREPNGGPEAELWLGAHEIAPSNLQRSNVSLRAAIDEDPDRHLGPVVGARFGELPFLLKVLAAAEPLSIQTHPSFDEAKAGFEAEEAAGLSRSDPARTYRDTNHKPELICALTPFVAKTGFRPLDETRRLMAGLSDLLGSTSELALLVKRLNGSGEQRDVLASVLEIMLTLDVPASRALVDEVVRAARVLVDAGEHARFGPELRWTAKLNRFHPGDIGVVVALLLNHVELEPGEALFLPAGNLHAYLQGAGVELMANSDNVIRGGLTVKHVDSGELARVVDTGPAVPIVQRPGSTCHRFDSPVAEFSLTRVTAGAAFEREGPDILLVTEGEVAVQLDRAFGATDQLTVSQGQAVYIPYADGPYRVVVPNGDHVALWRAAVGMM